MNFCQAKHPTFQTRRFDVFRSQCRNREGVERDMYSAFCRYEDVSRPACTIIVSRVLINGQPFVEWIEVERNMRHKKIGNEVLLGIQEFYRPMNASPVEHVGEKLGVV